MVSKENVSWKAWWSVNKKFVIGQNASLIGLCAIVYFCASIGAGKYPDSCVFFLIVGWACGGLTVGGISYLLLKERREEIVKLQYGNDKI